MTQRWRLFPWGLDDHSNPVMAVNVPGLLYVSAFSTNASQMLFAASLELRGFCNFTVPHSMIFPNASMRPSGPELKRSCTHLPHGSDRRFGSDCWIIGASPMNSAWSVITRKSSGRINCAGWPELEITFSPRAKRKPSSTPSVVPTSPASNERLV